MVKPVCSLLYQLKITQLPASVKPGFQWAIEAQQNIIPLPGVVCTQFTGTLTRGKVISEKIQATVPWEVRVDIRAWNEEKTPSTSLLAFGLGLTVCWTRLKSFSF